MLSFVHNDEILVEPCNVPKSWLNPVTGVSYINFDNISLDDMYAMGWKQVDENIPDFDERFYTVTYSAWRYDKDQDIVTRDYTLVEVSFESALINCSKELEKNRKTFEISGIPYTFRGMDLIIMSDNESQYKLDSTRTAAVNGTRQDTDIWRFKQLDGSAMILPVTNDEIIDISNFAYRFIQDTYNQAGAIMATMLGTGSTSALKAAIDDGTVNLNPWISS